MSDLEDVFLGYSGIQTDGWVIGWSTSLKKFVPKAGGAGGAGVGGTWASDNVGVYTSRNVGVGTTARSAFTLYVGTGNTSDDVAYFDGNISVAGNAQY